MQAFADFALQLTYPPNPIRNLDNSLTSDQQAGQNFFLGLTNNGLPSDTLKTCNGCHVLDPKRQQPIRRRSARILWYRWTIFVRERDAALLRIPHLRNLYQKVGKFGMSPDSLFPK